MEALPSGGLHPSLPWAMVAPPSGDLHQSVNETGYLMGRQLIKIMNRKQEFEDPLEPIECHWMSELALPLVNRLWWNELFVDL
jgi:hypothetical protein